MISDESMRWCVVILQFLAAKCHQLAQRWKGCMLLRSILSSQLFHRRTKDLKRTKTGCITRHHMEMLAACPDVLSAQGSQPCSQVCKLPHHHTTPPHIHFIVYVCVQVEPAMNPAQEQQAIGRIHRMGQEKPVTITRLYMNDTIETKIRDWMDE